MNSKKQKRRSISVRGDIYDRVYSFCKEQNMSMSSFVEDRILYYMDHPEIDVTAAPPAAAPSLPEIVALPDKPLPVNNTPITPPPPITSHIQPVSELSDNQLIEEMKQHFTF